MIKKTRNLFVLVGAPQDIITVLDKLQFKGLITNSYWNPISPQDVEAIFKCNKSVVCSADDYTGKTPPTAITINVVTAHIPQHIYSAPCTIYSLDNLPADVQFAKIADSLELDIGDFKSNSSGMEDGPTVKDCAYCKYLNGEEQDNERTIYRTENFFVIPTLGQFETGYLLIIPYEHVMSNGELAHEVLDEFLLVLEDIEFILNLTYPNSPGFLVWENGSGSSGKGKAKDSLVHSHVHIAPTSLTSEKIAEMSGFNFETLTLHELSNFKEHSYLLMRCPDKKHWIINNSPNLYIPRQYVRQLIAEELHLSGDDWNWRTHPFNALMKQTVIDIVAAIRANYDNLPDRIKKNTSFLLDA